MESFKSSGVFTKQAHVDVPEGLFEEEHGRKGFFGRVSHLYHTNPPVDWVDIEGDLRPQCLPLAFDKKIDEDIFQPILQNHDVVISLGKFKTQTSSYFRNADYDELWFIHEGQSRLETTYGHIQLIKGDYVLIPRGTTYKNFIQGEQCILRIESASEFEQPSRGILGPNALFDQTSLFTPEAAIGSEVNAKTFTVEIKRCGKITKIKYPFNPLDVKGWKGSVYPFKLSIYDFCPVMSHRYHMPPSAHTTFVAKNFVICSFVERPLEDSKHKVLKVPFYHANIDYDEVLFYHKGNFFSRDNIGPGSITFHPQGVHHGPHPKAFENADKRTYTDEYAVMIDTRLPLTPTKWFSANEDQNYWKSWMKK